MAIGYLKNSKCFVGALDLSGLANTVSLPVEIAELDNTPLNNTGWTSTQLGLFKGTFSLAGWREFGAGLSDQLLFAGVGGANAPLSVWTPSAADGGLTWISQLTQVNYAPAAKVGELEAFSASGPLVWPLVRGNSLATATPVAAGVGTGTAFNLGAISAAQYLYAILHVTAYATFTSLTVKLQSDDAEGFPTPLDRLTFTTNTAVGSQWATPVAGPITDTWWRAIWTTVGAGSATIAVAMGIQ